MAVKVIKTSSKPLKKDGFRSKTTIRDSGEMSGRQKTAVQKKQISSRGAAISIAGEAAASATSAINTAARERTKRESERQKTYQQAIAKWNGILKSTPENAEGTNPGLDGVPGDGTNTGTNPWIMG